MYELNYPPPSMPKVRTTISIDESVLDDWQSIAKLQGTSLSSLVNEWLDDLSESARYKALRVHQGDEDTRAAIAEINAALSVVQEGYLQAIGKKGSGSDRASAQRVPLPPSCNTGGKLPTGRGGRSA